MKMDDFWLQIGLDWLKMALKTPVSLKYYKFLLENQVKNKVSIKGTPG